MSKFINLINMTFGRLKVIEYKGNGMWLCECSCPEHNQVVVYGYNLKNGHTKSCGCLQKENMVIIGSIKKPWKPIEIDDYTYGIPLTQGKIAFIDKEDYDKIKDCAWWADYDKVLGDSYAKGWINGKNIRMHRLILNVPNEIPVDHIDHNTLNNRKTNLRVCTQSQNCMNKKLQSNNTTGYKGVYLNKKTKKYRASIRINRKLKHLGYFNTAAEAYKAYKTVAKNLHGEFYCE